MSAMLPGFSQPKLVRVLAYAGLVALALAVRVLMFPFIGGDMYHDFLVWYNTIVQHGGWIGLTVAVLQLFFSLPVFAGPGPAI